MCGRPVRALGGLRSTGLLVYNTEAQGALHDQLLSMPGYRCSEYLGPGHTPGEVVGDTVHEDSRSSPSRRERRLVLSSDVLEHVPHPYRAHAEVHRAPRRRPSRLHGALPPARTSTTCGRVRADGAPELLAEAIYHDDPVRPEGVLVYTIFGLEMLVRLAELGFDPRMYRLWEPWHGIVGPNALVFEAVKA